MSPLCSYCAQIPFDPDELSAPRAQHNYSLGAAGRVRGSDCPFCRLVSFALYEDIRTAPDIRAEGAKTRGLENTSEVTLQWGVDFGPAERAAFRVYGGNDLSICFVRNAPIDSGANEEFCLNPLDDQVSVRRVRNWISRCLDTHGTDCNVDRRRDSSIGDCYRGLKLLRFIDVIQNCLVETTKPLTYIALSYVWGLAVNFRLTTFNRAYLMKENAICDFWSKIPNTIQDAIVLVRELGERYLWVDALCLLQNDSHDLESGVEIMDLLYERPW
jgi:hypothetical protein